MYNIYFDMKKVLWDGSKLTSRGMLYLDVDSSVYKLLKIHLYDIKSQFLRVMRVTAMQQMLYQNEANKSELLQKVKKVTTLQDDDFARIRTMLQCNFQKKKDQGPPLNLSVNWYKSISYKNV